MGITSNSGYTLRQKLDFLIKNKLSTGLGADDLNKLQAAEEYEINSRFDEAAAKIGPDPMAVAMADLYNGWSVANGYTPTQPVKPQAPVAQASQLAPAAPAQEAPKPAPHPTPTPEQQDAPGAKSDGPANPAPVPANPAPVPANPQSVQAPAAQ